MKSSKPILHARDHMPGGADPIPALFPPLTGSFKDYMLSFASLEAWYRLGTGDPGMEAAIDSKNDYDLGSIGDESKGDLYPHAEIGDDDQGKVFYGGTTILGGPGPGVGYTGESYSFNVSGSDGWTMMGFFAPTEPPLATLYLDNLVCGFWNAGGAPPGGVGFFYNPSTLHSSLRWDSGLSDATLDGPDLLWGQWYHLAVTWDQTTLTMYVDGIQVASGTPGFLPPYGGAGSQFFIASVYTGEQVYIAGVIDEVALFSKALTAGEIGQFAVGFLPGADEGSVPQLDEDGDVVWKPPTFAVIGGGGKPDETPKSGTSPTWGGETSPDGWQLDIAMESVVLYDSSPGRFDVPSRKWVRVPFNSVRIWRRWQTSTSSPNFDEAWLVDDRGLTKQAREGILHINSGMLYGEAQRTLGGYFSIEYPVLDYYGLPDDDPEVGGDGPRPADPIVPGDDVIAPDSYARVARMVNLSRGQVVRAYSPEGGTPHPMRRFFEWQFWSSADGIPVCVDWDIDQPYPQYPFSWPNRPLTMPPPYPKMGAVESRDYYKTYQDNPGFTGDNIQVEIGAEVGDNYCLQAWQDSPWPLRFSTDHFPDMHRGIIPDYYNRPYLAFDFRYDPDSINHTTGKLKL